MCDGGGGGNINACDLVSDLVEVVRTYLHMNLYSVLWEMFLLHMLSFSPSRELTVSVVRTCVCVCVCVCVCLCAQSHWLPSMTL